MLPQYVILRRQPLQKSSVSMRSAPRIHLIYESPQIASKALLLMSALQHLWEHIVDQALCLHVGGAWSRGVVCTHRAWVLSWF